MPYIGNVLTSFAVETGNITDQAVTTPKLSATGGTEGQVLGLDAGGNLVWTSDPAGQWVTNGNDIYFDRASTNTNVATAGGIFVANTNTAANNVVALSFTAEPTDVAHPAAKIGAVFTDRTTDTEDTELYFSVVGAGTASEALRIDSSGRVGIGISTPGSYEIDADDLVVANTGGNAGLTIHSASTGVGSIYFADGTTDTEGFRGRIEYSQNSDTISFGTAGAGSKLLVDSGGNVGIGTVEPGSKLEIVDTIEADANNAYNLVIRGDDSGTDGESAQLFIGAINSSTRGVVIAAERMSSSNNHDMLFKVSAAGAAPTERMRLDSSGRLLVGTNTSQESLSNIQCISASNATISIFSSDVSASGEAKINLGPSNNITGAQVLCTAEEDFSTGANRTARLAFTTRLDGTIFERMRIRSNGDVTTTTDATFSRTTAGFTARNGDAVQVTRSSGTPLEVSRTSNDGTLVQWFRDNTVVGNISVASGTVSYNPFLGSHWARLEDGSKPEILPGTILETINKLVDWRIATFTVNGEQKISIYHGPANVGDTVQIEYEGETYDAIVSLEEDPTGSLNKHVCVKVSDTAASAGVYGVFLAWDEDVQSEYINSWNDLYCAAVGNYFIRIAAGETVAIGDLIESDGTGCGVVQSDDIIRSKTVGKVTSTIAQETYADGSFLVTCVLCCG